MPFEFDWTHPGNAWNRLYERYQSLLFQGRNAAVATVILDVALGAARRLESTLLLPLAHVTLPTQAFHWPAPIQNLGAACGHSGGGGFVFYEH